MEEKIQEKSCGCIIIRDDGKILLIKQTQGHWGFPKGHVEKNETEIETATREVKEETNLDVSIDESKRYTEHYYTNKGRYKEVVIFVAHPKSLDVKKQDEEITDTKWCEPSEVINQLTYDSSKNMFKEMATENHINL